jgi:hypothetical protein
MKRTLLFFSMLGIWAAMMAQYPNVTIRQIQEVSAMNLQNCDDTASFIGDTVTTAGVVITPGGIAFRNDGHNVWIQTGAGPWNGLNIDDASEDNGLDLLIPGDSIQVTGVVSRFNGETQIDPIAGGVVIEGAGKTVFPNRVAVGDLGDANNINQLPTGEQWEGQYVELIGPVTVDFLFPPFSGRTTFLVRDAAGNKIEIEDRFPDGRAQAGGGNLIVPQVGTVYDTLRGVLLHTSPNGCLTSNFPSGYTLNPFKSSDFVVQAGSSAPLLSNLTQNPISPTSSTDCNVTITAEDVDGTIQTIELFYAVGASTMSYSSLRMTNIGGDNYAASIPNLVYSDGDLVKYYVCATDNDNRSVCLPDVPGGNVDPRFFVVRDNGVTIRDIQFTPFGSNNGRSGFTGLDVTIQGVVTASAQPNSLGFVYIQQPNETQWAGIPLLGNPALANLQEGDLVEVSGTVADETSGPRGHTYLNDVTSVRTISTGNTVDTVDLDPSIFSAYDFQVTEPYEGMLVRLVSPQAGNKLYVVSVNPDGPNNNFAEYRIGTDRLDPPNGCRVLTGRQTGFASSSLYVSYVNDSTWFDNSGQMEVPLYVVTYEDSMDAVTGVMTHTFGNMKLLPRRNSDYENYDGARGPGPGTSVEGPLAGSEVLAYPNPVEEQLNVRYRFPVPAEAQVVLRDMLGRSVAQRSVSGTEGRIAFTTSNLAQGAYVLTVEAEGAVVARKKVIVK